MANDRNTLRALTIFSTLAGVGISIWYLIEPNGQAGWWTLGIFVLIAVLILGTRD